MIGINITWQWRHNSFCFKHLLLRPETLTVFPSCANYGFCHLNLAGITEKDSGRSSKMQMAFSSPHRPELWKCFTPLILSVLVFVTRNFTDTNTSNFAISSNFYKKGWNYAWTKDWDLLLLGWLRKGFITHSFCKWPFYTLQSAKPM